MTQVDSQTVSLDHDHATSVTLTWNTETDDKGDYNAIAASEDTSDSASVSVFELHERTVTAVSPGGSASVSRDFDGGRATVATALGGGASTSWTAPNGWALPTAPNSGRHVVLTPSEVSSDHDAISLEGMFNRQKVTELEPYYSGAGVVDRNETAYGAFRRIPRDGTNPITVIPGDDWTPPFDERQVVPEDFSADQISNDWYQISIDFGLESPRARDALERDGDTRLVSSNRVTLDAESSGTTTLQWTPDGGDIGEWLATVEAENYVTPNTFDDTLVSVTDAPFVLNFPVETLYLTRDQVGQSEQSATDGVIELTIPLTLDASQAAVILAVGSRVEAAAIRSVPDASNVVVDTLPDEELTCTFRVPEDSNLEGGEYVLSGWDVSRASPAEQPYRATIQLLRE